MLKEQEDPKLLRTFKGHMDEVNSVSMHPQWYKNYYFSQQIASCSNDCMVFVWNLNTSGNIYKYIGHRVILS